MRLELKLLGLLCWAVLAAGRGVISTNSIPETPLVGTESAQISALPELPRIFLDTTYIQPPGRVLNVSEGENLQTAINEAKPGDVIALQPGAKFIGNFTLTVKPSNGSNSPQDWIVIRSAVPDSCLPAPGTRITPEFERLLPKIISPDGGAAIGTDEGAHHYRLIGLEIGIVPEQDYNVGLVRLGNGSSLQNLLDVVPHDLIIDRCYIHGNNLVGVARGVALNSARTSIIDSYISEIHGLGFDTQAICGWNGPGPFKIVNNYLEASGENLMFGGSDPSIPNLVPADIEVRGNYFHKPMRWKVGSPEYEGSHWTVKNLLELKLVERILIEGNILDNNWADAQTGFALVFKSVNQDGTAPWSVTSDVTFINNIVRNSYAGINLLGRDESQPGQLMKRLLIRNNLFEAIDGTRFGGPPGIFLQISNVPDVIVDHNTVLHTGHVISTYGERSPGFVYTNNLSAHNEYGVKGDGHGTGNDTLQAYFPDVVFSNNVLAGGASNAYPDHNYFPPSLNDVKFISETDQIYRLATISPYVNAGEDGKDLGCDFDTLGRSVSKLLNGGLRTRNSIFPNTFCGRIPSPQTTARLGSR
ncbi:MAG: hypothetical protein JST85_11180 [Acidobacteria bacterium]|nr:hypothetical protein [Acidobacteriota bacterium]